MTIRIALFALFFALPITSLHSETITLVADPWCPYNCEADDELPGYMVEIATELFNEHGYDVDYIIVPWLRALDGVSKGVYTGAIAATPEEIPEAVFTYEPVGYFGNNFAVRYDSPWHYSGYDSLDLVSIGYIEGYDYGSFLNTYFKTHRNESRIQMHQGEFAARQLLKKLASKRIDVYVEDTNVINFTANKLGLANKIKVIEADFKRIPVRIAFSPRLPMSKEYARIFSEGVKKMKAEGRLNIILAKYGIVSPKD